MQTTTSIDRFVAQYPNIQANYCGTYAVDQLDSFKKCEKLVRNINAKRLPSCIFNTDPIRLPGSHWMSLLKLQDKQSFVLFDSFGARGFDEFLIGNRLSVVKSFFPKAYTYTTQKSVLYNEKVDIQPLQFLPNQFLALTKRELNDLSATIKGLGMFLSLFASDRKLNSLILYVVVDELQDVTTDIGGIFALYFLHSIYYPKDNDDCNTASCTIKTIENILDESFHEGSQEWQ